MNAQERWRQTHEQFTCLYLQTCECKSSFKSSAHACMLM